MNNINCNKIIDIAITKVNTFINNKHVFNCAFHPIYAPLPFTICFYHMFSLHRKYYRQALFTL